MTCDYPINVVKAGQNKNGIYYPDGLNVKCGKCYNCRISLLREWIFRLQQEQIEHPISYFVTLTYDNDNVPITTNKFMTLQKADLQKYIKRLRKTQKHNIKYYAVGEYGSKTERPHYHILLFNARSQKEIIDKWAFGTVHIGTITNKSIAYTLEYIATYLDKRKHARDDRELQFKVMSKGIGLNWLKQGGRQYIDADIKRNYIRLEDGTKISIPKIYKKHFTEQQKTQLRLHISKEVEEVFQKKLKEKGAEKLTQEIEARKDKLIKRLNKKTKL